MCCFLGTKGCPLQYFLQRLSIGVIAKGYTGIYLKHASKSKLTYTLHISPEDLHKSMMGDVVDVDCYGTANMCDRSAPERK